jgi:hypothetical protein
MFQLAEMYMNLREMVNDAYAKIFGQVTIKGNSDNKFCHYQL